MYNANHKKEKTHEVFRVIDADFLHCVHIVFTSLDFVVQNVQWIYNGLHIQENSGY